MSGVATVSQGAVIRLSTERGTNVLYPDVGVKSVAGGKGTIDKFIAAEFDVMSALLADRRIEIIKSIDVVFGVDSIEIVVDAILINQTRSRLAGNVVE